MSRSLLPLLSLALVVGCTSPDGLATVYKEGNVSPEGTGRYYMGREIAAGVETEHMLSVGDRPDRDVRELPDRLVAALDLGPADIVADIGSGRGYYTLRLARRVPHGRVLAVDVLQTALDSVMAQAREAGMRNVQPILGSETSPNLPAGRLDLALIVVSYHEFTHPREMLRGIVEGLRPGGRLVVIEYRLEDPTISVADVHRMSATQIRLEMEAAGLEYRGAKDVLPQQHMLEFRKPSGGVSGA